MQLESELKKILPSQKDVENKTKEIKLRIENEQFEKDLHRIENIKKFLYKNYKILLKKKNNTRFEKIIIDDCIKRTLYYKPPEQLELNYETICFYMALEELEISNENW